jgi:AcrR family transcriptional regulator
MATVGHPDAAGAVRPMRADARRNYQRIVSVAREVFAEHGAEAPLDDVAKRAGVGAGTLYRHFPNREALIEAVYREEIEQISRRAYELLEGRAPDEALADWMRLQIEFLSGRRSVAMTLKEALDKDSATFALCKTVMRDAAAAVLTPAQEAGIIREDVVPVDLLRLAHGIGLAIESAPEDADRLLSVVLNGLRKHHE